MTTPPPSWPEIPYPYPPERPVPERRDPVAVPIVYESGDPLRQLYERRTVVLGGPLDAATATRIAAELMSLDTDRPVELLVNSPGGPVGEVFAVLDVMALMRGPVDTTCVGRACGTAAAVLAAGTGRRRATPNATVSLRCAEESSVDGTADEVARQTELIRLERARLAGVLAAATGLAVERIEHELDAGTSATAADALELHLIDEVVAPKR
jgi:ATP-dependent Clp protease, protease subunit